MRLTAGRIDALNVGLLAATCAAAHLFPYQLLLLSYALLGPAHYLTQISWLHDRRYFVSAPKLAPALAGIALFAVLASLSPNGIRLTGMLVGVAFALAAVFATAGARDVVDPRALVAGAILVGAAALSPPTAVVLAVLVPTIVHVFIFTACFMWDGARKSGRTSAFVAFTALLIGAASFAIPIASPPPPLAGIAAFAPVVTVTQKSLGIPPGTETQIFGFLSFAYTYHYLNWFSKAEVIRWHQIPRPRAALIAVIYALSLTLYAIDYTLGFWLLLTLSLAHVLLEFPLNVRTLIAIGSRPR